MRKPVTVTVIVAAVTALDLWTKHLAASLISPYEPIELLSFFNLVNVQNRGAAFGMFAALGNYFFLAIGMGAIAFIIYLLARSKENPFALALIMAGALGNMADRLMLGYVRDFLDFHISGHHWPAFNVADSALTIGLALIIVLSMTHNHHKEIQKNSPVKE